MCNLKKTPLNEVFGIQNDIPKYTYLKRDRYDNSLKYYLKSQKHIVIHGASKQGKSCLRKQTFDNNKTLVIQCMPNKSADDLINDIYRELGIELPSSKSVSSGLKAGGSATGIIKTPISEKKVSGNLEASREVKYDSNFAQGYNHDFKKVKESIKNKRLILEDFHYLSEESRQKMAFYLKGLYEEKVFSVVIGIWSEQNLLTYYNGDLSGRIEELDLKWTDEELLEVINKGEKALRIKIDDAVKKELVQSSFHNVGLTQRLAEKLCFNAGIEYSTPWYKKKPLISDISLLQRAKSNVINDIRQRYIKILDVFERGFEETSLRVYFNIFKAISSSDNDALINGIPQNELLQKVKDYEPSIRLSDLTSGLNRVERLQNSRGITPFLLTYNENLREIHLVDREFLFYKNYGNPDWDWL